MYGDIFKTQSNVMGLGHVDGFNPYAAGTKLYGAGRSNPTSGPILDRSGYQQRDMETTARRNAILSRLKAGQRGQYASASYLGGSNGIK